MKFIIAGTPFPGHVSPLLSIARILIGQGHEVIGHTAGVMRDRFERIGAMFRPFLTGADFDMRDIDALFPARKHLSPGPQQLQFDIERLFIDTMPYQHAGLRQILRTFTADAIIADSRLLGTLPMLLGPRAERPAIVHCGMSFLPLPRDDGAPWGPGLLPAADDAQREEYRLMRGQIEDTLFTPAQLYLDRRLAEIGVGPLPMKGIFEAAVTLPDLYLQPSVPGFEYPRRNLPSSVHFIGALPTPPVEVPLPAWADDIDGSCRVVLVTQGTLANHDLGQLIAPTLAALADEPNLLVVATTGGRPVEAVPGPIPDNARLAAYLPFDWLMPKVDLVVSNGGYATISHALSLGIPLVVAGQTEDKPEVAARVAWSNVGINLGTDEPTVDALRMATRTVLDVPCYAHAAARLANEFANYDAKSEILRLVQALSGAYAQ